MPRKLRRPKTRITEIAPVVIEYLRTGELPTSRDAEVGWYDVFTKSANHDAGLRPEWDAAREGLLGAWIAEYPGTRPWAWWRFDAPRWPRVDWPDRQRDLGPWATDLFAEPRLRLSGIGTPAFEVLNDLPAFHAGVPASWVDPFSVGYYNGRARDIHGNPIGTEYHEGDFTGLAPDPHDPPRYESEAQYLRRHGLLTPEEATQLTPADFDPECVGTLEGHSEVAVDE